MQTNVLPSHNISSGLQKSMQFFLPAETFEPVLYWHDFYQSSSLLSSDQNLPYRTTLLLQATFMNFPNSSHKPFPKALESDGQI